MARQGFDPETRATRRGAEVVLRACPFADAAILDRETVCALHLGIAEGLVEGGDLVVDELVARDPHAAECRVRLRERSTTDPSLEATLTLRGKPHRRPGPA
jgi:predicted ArsR family transcriptional regulator